MALRFKLKTLGLLMAALDAFIVLALLMPLITDGIPGLLGLVLAGIVFATLTRSWLTLLVIRS
ncbi:MAG TPA: hypothetical protein ENI90_03610, partial [Methylothermaceae bacterium]|nr:hypothetical protein [Methylothermaceae bacterium]